MFKSHLTAITRNKPSAPSTFLKKVGLIQGRTLDYGCGKGVDADAYGLDKYDPYFFPNKPRRKYETIICNYVLNTLPKEKEGEILRDMVDLLDKRKKNSVILVTVRRDIDKEYVSKRNTYQRVVHLNAPIIKKTKWYCIYMFDREIYNYFLTNKK